jgi:hypothetical protein
MAISPPWVPAADASHGHEIFPAPPRLDADKDQSLSRTRNPHAVSSSALIFIDWMRSKPLFVRISNSAPLFSSPAIFFIFFHPCKPTGKKEKKKIGDNTRRTYLAKPNTNLAINEFYDLLK